MSPLLKAPVTLPVSTTLPAPLLHQANEARPQTNSGAQSPLADTYTEDALPPMTTIASDDSIATLPIDTQSAAQAIPLNLEEILYPREQVVGNLPIGDPLTGLFKYARKKISPLVPGPQTRQQLAYAGNSSPTSQDALSNNTNLTPIVFQSTGGSQKVHKHVTSTIRANLQQVIEGILNYEAYGQIFDEIKEASLIGDPAVIHRKISDLLNGTLDSFHLGARLHLYAKQALLPALEDIFHIKLHIKRDSTNAIIIEWNLDPSQKGQKLEINYGKYTLQLQGNEVHATFETHIEFTTKAFDYARFLKKAVAATANTLVNNLGPSRSLKAMKAYIEETARHSATQRKLQADLQTAEQLV